MANATLLTESLDTSSFRPLADIAIVYWHRENERVRVGYLSKHVSSGAETYDEYVLKYYMRLVCFIAVDASTTATCTTCDCLPEEKL